MTSTGTDKAGVAGSNGSGNFSHNKVSVHLQRKIREGLIRTFCAFCALISVVTTIAIVYILFSQALPFFTHVDLKEFATGTEWKPTPEPGHFGILPLVTGTLMITVGAGLFAVPLGLLSAIYLAEYAKPKAKAILKPALELLAGIPTVVYGYFGLFFVTPALRNVFPQIQSSNALAGAIVVGIMILPLVSSLCEDAISSVPVALKEGAQGLGATKAETTMKIVVPAAFSGIVASFILALSRALGETMAVTLAAGSNPILSLDPTKGIETMTAYMVSTSKGDIEVGTMKYMSIFAVGLVLFAFTFGMNMVARKLVAKFKLNYQ
ncbi:MAG: phosphate ABC transporter permease subunit PstC [Armatimonadota bacterium]